MLVTKIGFLLYLVACKDVLRSICHVVDLQDAFAGLRALEALLGGPYMEANYEVARDQEQRVDLAGVCVARHHWNCALALQHSQIAQ